MCAKGLKTGYFKLPQWLLVDVYMDIATSKTGSSRKEFNRMLDDGGGKSVLGITKELEKQKIPSPDNREGSL